MPPTFTIFGKRFPGPMGWRREFETLGLFLLALVMMIVFAWGQWRHVAKDIAEVEDCQARNGTVIIDHHCLREQ